MRLRELQITWKMSSAERERLAHKSRLLWPVGRAVGYLLTVEKIETPFWKVLVVFEGSATGRRASPEAPMASIGLGVLTIRWPQPVGIEAWNGDLDVVLTAASVAVRSAGESGGWDLGTMVRALLELRGAEPICDVVLLAKEREGIVVEVAYVAHGDQLEVVGRCRRTGADAYFATHVLQRDVMIVEWQFPVKKLVLSGAGVAVVKAKDGSELARFAFRMETGDGR